MIGNFAAINRNPVVCFGNRLPCYCLRKDLGRSRFCRSALQSYVKEMIYKNNFAFFSSRGWVRNSFICRVSPRRYNGNRTHAPFPCWADAGNFNSQCTIRLARWHRNIVETWACPVSHRRTVGLPRLTPPHRGLAPSHTAAGIFCNDLHDYSRHCRKSCDVVGVDAGFSIHNSQLSCAMSRQAKGNYARQKVV
jgi:hypothetical protein